MYIRIQSMRIKTNYEGSSGWHYGLYFFNGGGNAATSGSIRNNMISVGKPGNTSSVYGLYMSNSGYMKIYHNSVLTAFGGSFSRAFYPASGGENYVKNNIFANYTPGYAMYMGNGFSVTESDYNVLYSPNGNIGYLNGAQATLADWQNASSFDANSLDNNPLFYNSADLHICNDTIGNQGTPLGSIQIDIDGQLRDQLTPDMGADRSNGLSGSFLGPDLSICTGDSVQIAAGAPSDTILWSTGETTPFIWVSTPGAYTVSINGWCGIGTDAVVVNASALNYSNYLVATEFEFCAGDSVLLYSSQAADTYTWSGGSSATTDSIYATAGGTYTLDLTDACGSGTESIILVENTAPTPTFTSNTSFLTGIFTNTSTTAANPTYLWNFGDGAASTLVSPSHSYTTSGAYYVTLTITNDCGSATFGDSILLAIQGIDELLVNGDVTVYPNPSNGEFTVDMELITSSQVSFRVENLVGAVIYESNPITVNGLHTEKISLNNVPTGVYFVNILAGNNQLVKKIIVK